MGFTTVRALEGSSVDHVLEGQQKYGQREWAVYFLLLSSPLPACSYQGMSKPDLSVREVNVLS